MTFPEISLLVLAAIALISRARSGWRHGATVEFRYALTFLFATLVAARFWEPAAKTLTSAVTFDPRFVAVIAFLALFAVSAVVAGVVVRTGAKAYQSVKANVPDQVLGLVAGVFSGALIASCIIWGAQVAWPGSFDTIPAARSLAGLPQKLVTSVENLSGMAANSAGRTRYPKVTMVDVQVAGPTEGLPEGAILMQRRGKIDWE